jgi:hypothetical protein
MRTYHILGRRRVLTPVQNPPPVLGLPGDQTAILCPNHQKLVPLMTSVMLDEKVSTLDANVRPRSPVLSSTGSTNFAPLQNYVNVEKLLADVVRLHLVRDSVIFGLDELDAASLGACTPVRSTPARDRIGALLATIRDIEAIARKLWQEEFAAAGTLTPKLASLLAKAASADAKTVQKLVESDGSEISEAEFDDLMLVLDGTVVNPDRSGIGVTEYSANFVLALDLKVLSRLTDELETFTFGPYLSTPKGIRAATLLHELRMLFAHVFAMKSDSNELPKLATKVDSFSLKSLNLLLQPEHAPIVQPSISDLWLNRIAGRVLPDAATLASKWSNPHADEITPIRTTILRLLQSNQVSGGQALALYLKPDSDSETHLKAASRRLLSLVTPNSFLVHNANDFHSASQAEDNLAALLLRTHFAQAFDSSDPARVAEAGENLELLIASVKDLKNLSNPMTQALATGFAGAMVNPLINQALLDATLVMHTDGRLVSVGYKRFKPGWDNLFDFIGKLATEPEAIRTISAAFGPMIASAAKLEGGLPTDSKLVRGAGFIMGAMQVRLDKENESRRAFIEGLAISATVLFATAGAFAGGPIGSFAAGKAGAATVGFLGSGIIDFIASKVDTEQYPKDLPNSKKSVVDYFQNLYLLSSFQWLSPATKRKVFDEIALVSTGPGKLKAKFVTTQSSVEIVNIAELAAKELQTAMATIVSAGLAQGSSLDRNAATTFADRTAAAANVVRG